MAEQPMLLGLPLWVGNVSIVIAGVIGLCGVILILLMISAWLLERILRLVDLHHCFLDFMWQWVRKRGERA